uniref:Ataxin 7 like 2 n=1 Tax=Anser cygnoides TaxID=8845 RepID=A0A8B9IJ88_ANSCY
MCNFRSLHHFGSAGRCLAARGHGGCSCRGGDRAAPAPLCPVLAAGRGRRELRPARLVTAMALQQELTHSLQLRFYPRRRGWRSQQPLPAPSAPHFGEKTRGSGTTRALRHLTSLCPADMSIFGHCPAHDEFYLVVCNHCSQVVKPQAFQKHCERRHGPLSKLYARAAAGSPKCHAVNGQPAAKALREKPPGARGRTQPLPDKAQKDNLCSKDPPGRPSPTAPPKEPPVPAGVGGDSALPAAGPVRKPESVPAPGEKEPGACKPPPRSHKKPARKECDLNRQCGVLNPDTKKICTRLLTCKIHSVHQRREVQGRAKDFDVLVAELKASSRRESPKEKSPVRKEPLPERPAPAAPALPQPPAVPARLSSDSDPEEGDAGLFPLPLPKGGSRGSSEESEEEGAEDAHRPDCHYAARPPRPQAFCTFGSRLVSPGCYVFNRRLDRFCSALGSMLERHLSSHMWSVPGWPKRPTASWLCQEGRRQQGQGGGGPPVFCSAEAAPRVLGS